MQAVVMMLFAVLATPTPAEAAGKRRPNPGPTEPAESQAFPVRFLRMGNFSTAPFQLPGGVPADLGHDVLMLVNTQVNQSERFRTVVGQDPTQPHGIMSGGISALVFEVTSLGIKFGYRVGGEPVNEGGGTRLTGELTVKVGVLAMDFSIHDSVTGNVYSSVSVDQGFPGLNLSFKVDFDQIEIGPEFLLNTPLKDTVRAAAREAMRQMAMQPHVNFIPWSSHVLEPDLARGLLLFDAGVQQGIVPGNVFQVYTQCLTESCFQRYVGDVKVMNSHQYSEAKVLADPDGSKLRAMKAGDKVYIRYVPMF
jgi:hypothetical protein